MKKLHDIFLGRFQPFHLGHAKILDKMTNPIILLVKGKGTSGDTGANPLSEKHQIDMIKKYAPHAKVIVVDKGYLPPIIKYMKRDGYEVDTLHAGADRMDIYKSQLKSNDIDHINYKLTRRHASGTDVRIAIRSGDQKKFRKMMPRKLHGEWSKLRKLMK